VIDNLKGIGVQYTQVDLFVKTDFGVVIMKEGGNLIKNLPASKEGENESMSERIMLVI